MFVTFIFLGIFSINISIKEIMVTFIPKSTVASLRRPLWRQRWSGIVNIPWLKLLSWQLKINTAVEFTYWLSLEELCWQWEKRELNFLYFLDKDELVAATWWSLSCPGIEKGTEHNCVSWLVPHLTIILNKHRKFWRTCMLVWWLGEPEYYGCMVGALVG